MKRMKDPKKRNIFLKIYYFLDDDDDYKGGMRRVRKQPRQSISTAESQQVATFTQPPKERPDAKHHLKVS